MLLLFVLLLLSQSMWFYKDYKIFQTAEFEKFSAIRKVSRSPTQPPSTHHLAMGHYFDLRNLVEATTASVQGWRLFGAAAAAADLILSYSILGPCHARHHDSRTKALSHFYLRSLPTIFYSVHLFPLSFPTASPFLHLVLLLRILHNIPRNVSPLFHPNCGFAA